MSRTHDGGNAFPIPGLQDNSEFNGMTLRDYFAAKAMLGIFEKWDGQRVSRASFPVLAEAAYVMADAMLAERAK